MDLALIAVLSTLGLFAGMSVFAELGRRIGIARLARNSEGAAKGASAAEGAVFGLLGLLIAFSFSGAASRFEDRRDLIVQEANAIGTAYLRLDLLSAGPRTELQALFRRYVEVRMETYRGPETLAASEIKRAEGTKLQEEIWTKAVAASRSPEVTPQTTVLLLPALNEMIDITATRVMATLNHPPPVVFHAARRLEPRWRPAGRLRHVDQQGPKLVSHAGVRRHPLNHGVRHHRPGVPASGPDPG